ncbi:MAG: TMEM165/GDT1 family protein [Paracoccaceae bacterium]|nr:TMEM165/GDT1 family protein [Paracoccaceae bacterium]
MHLASILPTLTAAFLASIVEVVEAFTIVLAVALTRSWRPALIGTFAALGLLILLVLIFGPLFALIPLEVMQFVIGTLLILFGMRWLRKAILRASGYIALHDEAAAFAKETDALAKLTANKRADWLAGMAAFKAVLLEGVEVVFIVIAVGTAHQMIWIAGLGALAAAIAVLLVGAVVHKPLSTVPENTLKFAVGLMLTAFGIFWTGEGLGTAWPGADLSILGILVILLAVSLVAVQVMTGARTRQEAA